MKEVKISDIDKIVNEENCAFLCGNGFSINFDDCFGNIFDRLYEAHKTLIYKSKYKIYPKTNKLFKKKCLDNYNNVLSSLRGITEGKLYKIFDDGLEFANSIIENTSIIELMKKNDLLLELTFGRSQLDLVREICLVGNKYGVKSINIEYWSVLIYMYYCIETINCNDYVFPEGNLFISLIRQGNINKSHIISHEKASDEVLDNTYFNGFNTYYRMLFTVAIFCEGKHLDLKKLSKISKISVDKISNFLNSFSALCTLNYDNLLELVMPERKIYHLHGQFVLDREEYVYSQSLGMMYNDDKYVSFSDILIGDYFMNKIQRGIVNDLAQKEIGNKKTKNLSKTIQLIIDENQINTFLIFGMNIQNDQHILRNIIQSLFFANIHNPRIIYSYFTEEQRDEFNQTFFEVLTFSEELNEYARNIEIDYVNTIEILESKFNK